MLQPSLQKNDKKAHLLIWIFSIIVFAVVLITEKINLQVNLGFNPHVFALCSAIINSIVAILLVLAVVLVKQKMFEAHKKVMMSAMILSILFLVFYIAHHVFTGETKFGDTNLDGALSSEERVAAGMMRYIYYFIISTHITLAAIVMPFVLYSAYRALTGDYQQHKKLVNYTFPIWLYVAITGVIVYVMIQPYYA